MSFHPKKKIYPWIVILGFSLLFTFAFYGAILKAPNAYMFNQKGDALKNYYTYAYHIIHNQHATNFEGMNYPYGESYLYTDSHPFLTSLLKSLSTRIPSIHAHAIGILNLLMIVSIFLTFLIIYALLLELHMHHWLSILFSISITLLSPQVFRMDGHFSLSYSIAIPLSWLLYIKYCNKGRIWWLLALLISNTIWLFTHAYLGVMVNGFILTLALISLSIPRERKKRWQHLILLGLSVLIPVSFYYLFAKFTDLHQNRPLNPVGFFNYSAGIEELLLPFFKPLGPIVKELSGGNIRLDWEGWGYLGVMNVLLLLTLIVRSIWVLFRKKARILPPFVFSNRAVTIGLAGASIILLFAFGFPFKQIPSLLELFPMVKQFRSTGRFVWPFYFTFSVFGAWVFQQLILQFINRQQKLLGYSLTILLMGFGLWEGIPYHQAASGGLTRYGNAFSKKDIPLVINDALKTISPNHYQALLPIPFFYSGSGHFSRDCPHESIENTLIFSFHTGLPTFGASLPRASIHEGKHIIQLFSPNYYEKKILQDIPNNKPILIIRSMHPASSHEEAILQKAQPLYANESIELLSISLDSLFSDEDSKVLQHYQEQQETLISQNGFLTSDSCSVLYYNGFESRPSDTIHRGRGAFSSVKRGSKVLTKFPAGTFDTAHSYSISLWLFNGEPEALNDWLLLNIYEHDSTGHTVSRITIPPDKAEVINGNWSLAEGTFRVYNPMNIIQITTSAPNNSTALLHADDLLIKDQHVDVFCFDTDSTLFYNNHRILRTD